MRSKSTSLPLPLSAARSCSQEIAPGAVLLHGFALQWEKVVVAAVDDISAHSPFRHMLTPSGHRMSVAMTNCGSYGWITDRSGYRYSEFDPLTGGPWPSMPPEFSMLANNATSRAGFTNFSPDACLINRYEPGARMALHQDKDERDINAPIVSVSLGLPIIFLFGGMTRKDKPMRIPLEHGDVVVWGGPARLRYHGVMPLKDGEHPAFGNARINLTLRKAR
ncbi:MAG: DNA oxidative demethylase AlkB [Gammaproteobacteria bacterium]